MESLRIVLDWVTGPVFFILLGAGFLYYSHVSMSKRIESLQQGAQYRWEKRKLEKLRKDQRISQRIAYLTLGVGLLNLLSHYFFSDLLAKSLAALLGN